MTRCTRVCKNQINKQILGANYKSELLKWIDEDSLMAMFGGSSAGTLAEDVGPWNDPELMVGRASGWVGG